LGGSCSSSKEREIFEIAQSDESPRRLDRQGDNKLQFGITPAVGFSLNSDQANADFRKAGPRTLAFASPEAATEACQVADPFNTSQSPGNKA